MFLRKKRIKEKFEEELFNQEKLTKPIDTVKDKWKLLPAFIETRGLQKQHIDSYNYFINQDMKKIIEANQVYHPDSDPQYFWEYTNIYVTKPTKYQDMRSYDVTPQECRLRDITYHGEIKVDIRYTKGRKLVSRSGIQIGRIPIMLQSCKCHLDKKSPEELAAMDECPLDPGGYFVLKGVEKVLLIQEQQSKNRIFVEYDKKKNIQSSCASSTHELKSKTNVYCKKNKFYLKHNVFVEDIPIIIAFRALGVQSDMELLQLIGGEREYVDAAIPSLKESDELGIHTQDQALQFIGKKIKSTKKVRHIYGISLTDADQAREMLAKVVLCHIRVVKYNFRMKIVFLSLMIRKMINAINDPSSFIDDKDYYGNKRLELAGGLLSLLFEDLFKSYNSDLKKMADNSLSKKNRSGDFDITHLMEGSNKITRGLSAAIQSGNWNIKRFKMERSGVTQVLSRLSFISTLGHMTRINSQFEKTRKISGPRALQPSQWGMLCPSDTPEGESCGLIKNLALMSHVTVDADEEPIIRISYTLGVEDIEFVSGKEISGNYVVFVNGLVIGIHSTPDLFIKNFKSLRRKGKINEFVSIFKNGLNKSIFISCDGGRLCRPVIIVDKMRSRVTQKHLNELHEGIRKFDDFLKEGIVEYLDVNEENNSLIAIKEENIRSDTTHLEIEPFTILGVCIGLIPYPHHNQSPRNTYQCAMGKQAMGAISYNQFSRIDTQLYLLVYPQKPLVKTKTIDLINWEKVPGGQNAVIAVMSYSGYDIEDAIILNSSSLDRGFGRCILLKKFVETFQTYGNQTKDVFEKPEIPKIVNENLRKKYAKYQRLDHDGIVCEGERIYPTEIIVNKYVPTITEGYTDAHQVKHKEQSMKYKSLAHGYVSKVIISSSDERDTIVKTLIRSTRRPELGDKFSSRHGQKGVCGMTFNQEDMPFNDEGICPDIICNPHGFPSRMTVGQMIELINGKSGIVSKIEENGNIKGNGKLGYGTAFGGDKVSYICKKLVESGYSYSGKDYLTSGITGEGLNSYIFHGPVYYQKLKHMVMDKVHARARGPKAGLTRQPTVGRSRDGGFRLGEMERDCLVGYGAAYLLLERFTISSDLVKVDICDKCGLFGYSGYCQYCKSKENIHQIKIPYATKLMLQELLTMNIFTKIHMK